MTLQHSMDLFGEGGSMSSPVDSRARMSRSPVSKLDLMGQEVASGTRCLESFVKSDLALSWLRTSLTSEIRASTQFLTGWKKQATPAGRSWWVLTTSAQPINESGSLSLPKEKVWMTPNTMDTLPPRTGEALERAFHRGGESSRRESPPNLREQVTLWPPAEESSLWRTPDTGQGGPSMKLRNGITVGDNGHPLQMRLVTQAMMWPSPRCGDGMTHPLRLTETLIRTGHRGRLEDACSPVMWPTPTTISRNSRGAIIKEGEVHQNHGSAMGLEQVAEVFSGHLPKECRSWEEVPKVYMWPTPTTRDWKDGANPSPNVPTNGLLGRAGPRFPQEEATSEVGLLLQEWTPPSCPVLNPAFVTGLMGFPLDWFDGVDAPETPRSKRSVTP